jgi:hypothetical protein
MRPLTEQETKTLFEKLANYTGTYDKMLVAGCTFLANRLIGASLKNLIQPLDDSPNADRYVFRVVKDRVYYVLLSIANLATSIARDKLSSLGTCLGSLPLVAVLGLRDEDADCFREIHEVGEVQATHHCITYRKKPSAHPLSLKRTASQPTRCFSLERILLYSCYG